MYDRRQKIMEKIQTLPKGSVSASGSYWCVTCKKLFRMEQPICPYMTAICVNSPIALEKFVPESTEWLEKMGLFYPKIPQMVMAALLKENPAPLGKRLAETCMTGNSNSAIRNFRRCRISPVCPDDDVYCRPEFPFFERGLTLFSAAVRPGRGSENRYSTKRP